MEAWERRAAADESPEVARLRECSAEILDRLAAASRTRTGGVRSLVGLPALVLQLRHIAPAATRSAMVMQPQYAYDPEDPGVALAKAARARGVGTHLITRPASVRTHPLLSSIFPTTLLGPVFLRALVIDGRQAIVGAPDDVTGQRCSWYTTVPDIVGTISDLWAETVPLCEPILPPGTQPPLTEQQLEVARLLCVGEEDSDIALLLDLPLRTVELDVQRILTELCVRNRTEAVLTMRGRGVNGGRRNAYV